MSDAILALASHVKNYARVNIHIFSSYIKIKIITKVYIIMLCNIQVELTILNKL